MLYYCQRINKHLGGYYINDLGNLMNFGIELWNCELCKRVLHWSANNFCSSCRDKEEYETVLHLLGKCPAPFQRERSVLMNTTLLIMVI